MFDNMFETMKVSSTALSAERQRMNVIANNLANINTTGGPNGDPYRRKYVLFKTLMDQNAENGSFHEKGVKVSGIVEDSRPFQKVHKPGHPDADSEGYVSFPNISMVEENVDLLAASRAYEANLSVMKASKDMIKKIIELVSAP